MLVLPYMLGTSRIGKHLEFSYITGTLWFTAAWGVVSYMGASSVASSVFMCLDPFPDAQIKTTHEASSLQICQSLMILGRTSRHMALEGCNYSAFVKAPSNIIATTNRQQERSRTSFSHLGSHQSVTHLCVRHKWTESLLQR